MNKIQCYNLLTINYSRHPILKEEYQVRYYYFSVLYLIIKKYVACYVDEIKLLTLFRKRLGIEENDYAALRREDLSNKNEFIHRAIKKIKKPIIIIKFRKLKIVKRYFKYLLVTDLLYILKSEDIKFRNDDMVKAFKRVLKLSYRDYSGISEYVNRVIEDVNEKKLDADINAGKGFVHKKFNDLRFYNDEKRLRSEQNKKEQFQIAMLASMSSGKSTVMNSLIGDSLLPARNEACTSKLTKVYQNENLDRFIGYKKAENKIEIEAEITHDQVDKWNSDKHINEIFIEGGLPFLANQISNLLFIDTPGPNNSMEDSHGHLTRNLVKNLEFDLVLYIINTVHIGSDDDTFFLSHVNEHLKDRQVIFLLNKIDRIDVESGESVAAILATAEKHLKEIGFINPLVIPISSYSALLFQRVLKRQVLSRKEKIDFIYHYDLFSEDLYGINSLMKDRINLVDFTPVIGDEDYSIEVKGEEFSSQSIYNALGNTGFFHLCSILNTNRGEK